MTGAGATDEATGQEHPTGVFRGLFVSAVEAVRTRLDLAAVEAEIFVLRAIQLLLWALAAVACGLLALAFAVVAVVAALWDSHRMAGVLGGALLFIVLAAVFAFIASRTFRERPHLLDGTLAQLETDRRKAGGTP
ncbi:MAG: phage holin family protein [Steroidobacteraceae bacterium]